MYWLSNIKQLFWVFYLSKVIIYQLSLFSWLNKQTDLKGRQHSYHFTLFIFSGPCHFPSLGILFSSENSVFIQLWKKKKKLLMNLYYYLIDTVNIIYIKYTSYICTINWHTTAFINSAYLQCLSLDGPLNHMKYKTTDMRETTHKLNNNYVK